MIAFKNNRYQ